MARRSGSDGSGGLSAARGREAPPEELRLHLASGPAAFLEGALQNPDLSVDELVMLLRNRAATPALLGRIGRNRTWTRSYEVKKGLVHHPKTPLAVSRNLVPHLYWRDLAEAAGDVMVHPSVRRRCEELLQVRLDQLSLGEKISLARVASRGLIGSLRRSGERRVLSALLGNPRLVERDVVIVASGEEVPGSVLESLAEHPVWGARQAIRLSVLENPRTPVRAALRLLRRLGRRDLQRLARDNRVPKIVRVGAERSLAARNGPASRRIPGGP